MKISCLVTYREANDLAYMPLLREDQKDYIYHLWQEENICIIRNIGGGVVALYDGDITYDELKNKKTKKK